MCTVTWWHHRDEAGLLFNRDERRGRLDALPPEKHERDGVTFSCPIDGDFGGTWLWVNEYGLTACLLNNYPEMAPAPPANRRSRGLLMTDIASAASLDDLDQRLHQLDLSRYEPFFMVALERNPPARLWTWDGRSLTAQRDATKVRPLTTSSFASDEVTAERRELFAEGLRGTAEPDLEFLEHYHRHRVPGKAAFSVMMERVDARTVSLSRVRLLSDGTQRMTYEAVREDGSTGTPAICTLPGKTEACAAR